VKVMSSARNAYKKIIDDFGWIMLNLAIIVDRSPFYKLAPLVDLPSFILGGLFGRRMFGKPGLLKAISWSLKLWFKYSLSSLSEKSRFYIGRWSHLVPREVYETWQVRGKESRKEEKV